MAKDSKISLLYLQYLFTKDHIYPLSYHRLPISVTVNKSSECTQAVLFEYHTQFLNVSVPGMVAQAPLPARHQIATELLVLYWLGMVGKH